MGLLTKENVSDLLAYIGVGRIGPWKRGKINFCCPIHHESHPSAGIITASDGSGYIFNCFSCGEKGGLPYFLFKSKPDSFRSVREAERFLSERYGASFGRGARDFCGDEIPEYGCEPPEEGWHVLPESFIAPFHSGERTHPYFYERGFTIHEVRHYGIGYDEDNGTITVPVRWEDGKLAGVIGRYCDKSRPHNMRFKVYGFPKGSLVWPLDKIASPRSGESLVVVEGMFDRMRLAQNGCPFSCSIMGMDMSERQAGIIAGIAGRCILLLDMDEAGARGRARAKRLLEKRGVEVFAPAWAPKIGKDACEWEAGDLARILESAEYDHLSGLERI
jgi:DNA primase